jgi:putative hydrolase
LATHRRPGGNPDRRSLPAIADPNLEAASLLYDMAALQESERSGLGYKRAARAVAGLSDAVADRVRSNTLREVPYVGPSSAGIVTEFVEHGHSPTVDAAVARSGKTSQIRNLRKLREGFLSHHILQQALDVELGGEIVSRDDYRGDLQMHSTWSDGAASVAEMAAACEDLGYTRMGVTDHSYGLPVARGMSMTAAARQRLEIDRLNSQLAGRFRIYKGVEANILSDGALDLTPPERGEFEYVVAAAHSQLRGSDDQSARMLAAVRASGVAILGHPRGRMFGKRLGVVADWDRVFETAAELEVAIELDGNWHRQDLDYALASRAFDAGCIFAVDSDGHAPGELRFADYALAHARIAGIPGDRIINCWDDERLEAWMAERRRA